MVTRTKRRPVDRTLAALNRKLAAAMAAFLVAQSEKNKALGLFGWLCPPPSSRLRVEPIERTWATPYAEEETDPEGATAYRDGRQPVDLFFTVDGIKRALEEHSPRSKIGIELSFRLPVAIAYETVREAAIQASGVTAAIAAYNEAKNKIEQIAKEVCDTRGHDPDYAKLKAHALLELAKIGTDEAHHQMAESGADLARTVLGR